MTVLTPAETSAIVGGRDLRVVVELLAAGLWCEITRESPIGNHSEGSDPGVSRLVAPPVVRRMLQLDSGRFATEPITLILRNDDGFFDHTKSVTLFDVTGTPRVLRSLKRARIRIRFVSDATGTDATVYQGFIDKISTDAHHATVKVQPLERLLQTVSPKEIKQGDRWYRDVDVGVLVRRVFEHAVPGLTWRSDSPPARVFKSPRPESIPSGSLPRLGPLMDGWGRQPERVGSTLVFDSASVPTYIVESAHDTDLIYYAVWAVSTRQTRLYSYRISTGASTLFHSGQDNRPCIFMRSVSETDLVFAVMGIETDQITQTRNRDCSLYSVNPSTGGGLVQRVQSGMFSGADGWIPFRIHDDSTYSIGVDHPTYGWEDGEMICVGHPQCVYAYRQTTEFWMPNSQESLRTSSEIVPLSAHSVGVPRVYNHTGFTQAQSASTGGGGEFTAWYHPNPFGFPWLWIERLDHYAALRYASASWRVRRYNHTTQTELADVPLSYQSGDDLRLRQMTGWCAVSQTNDVTLPNTNWIIMGVIGYRQTRSGTDPSNVYYSGLWRINLDTAPHATLGWYPGNSGLIALHEEAPDEGDPAPWPTFLDMTYLRSWASGDGPWIIGCYLDRKTKMYGIFAYGLANDEMYYGWGNSPMSGAPFVGFREIYDPANAAATRHVVFRDCATGALMACQAPDAINSAFWVIGDGRAVGDGTETWEACPKLAYVRNTSSWKSSRVLGFTAPTSPIWSWPIDAGTYTPLPTAVGSYQLWSVGPNLTVRVPIADFREDLIKSCDEALAYLAQLCGPRWRYGFDASTGEAFFAEHPASPVPDFRLIDPRTDGFNPHALELPGFGIERDETTGDDVQNQILVTPHVAEVPPVAIKVELAPRDSDQFDVGIAAAALTDAARKVTLNVVRDGLVGDLDLGVLTDFDDHWGSHLLISFVCDAEDIVTELAGQTGTYASLIVRGIGPAPSGLQHERAINGTVIRAGLTAFGWHGDFITVGDSDTRRITGFGLLDVIQTDGPAILDGTLPIGTLVRIQSAQGKGLYADNGAEHGYVHINGAIGTGTTTCQVLNGDGVHVGDVLLIEQELVLVTAKANSTAGDPYSHAIKISRGYLGTNAVAHPPASGPYKCQVFLHPRRSGSYRIGATGLAVTFTADPTSEPALRSFKSGDRILLESPGSRAVPSKFSRGIADGPQSQIDYGKRSFKIDRNPYISPLLAPHVAWEWLQELQIARVPISVAVPLAPEIQPEHAPYVVSHLRFPDESSNLMQFDILTLEHDVRAGLTRLRLISREAPETEASASGGVGLPGGGS